MPVPLLIAVAIVLLVGLLFAIDRMNKAIKRIGRRREANRRLVAAAAVAEAKNTQRKAAAEASKALTSLIPAIQEHDTRHVR
jgi:Tfp pilus assembly protein PilE